jgi:hypothetical protein
VHDSLSSALPKSLIKVGTVVLRQVVASEWLTAVFVNTLKNLWCSVSQWYPEPPFVSTDLVTCGITETGEERGELASQRRVGIFLEDDFVEFTGRRDLAQSRVSQLNPSVIRIAQLTRVWLLISRFAVVSTLNNNQYLVRWVNSELAYRVENEQFRNTSRT